MNAQIGGLWRSSVFRKQIVAVTGLIWVGFIFMHMAANLLLFLGPEALNGYSEMLHAIPELLWMARLVLVAAFVLHVTFTVILVVENRSARSHRYEVLHSHGETNFVKKTMILSGLLVFFFVFIHLTDFTLPAKTGPDTVIAGQEGEVSYGLYGLVWNAFGSVPRALFYILIMVLVGMHLSHGIQSLFQTIGFFHDRYTPLIRRASIVLGVIVAVGFILVPLYVIFRHFTIGPAV